jgi:adenylate cyclase
MFLEIERKFLVTNPRWRLSAGPGEAIRQGYLSRSPDCSVRVRVDGARATITVKGPRDGLARSEFEYEAPLAEGEVMLRDLCAKPLVEKVRHKVEHGGLTWDVDVYSGEAAGLVIAEVELERADQPLSLPEWVGREVTHDPRYRNSALAHGLRPERAPELPRLASA